MSTQPQKIVDLRLPLPWLISAAASVALFMATLAWQAAGQSNKLDQIIIANNKMEKRLDDRDIRLDTVRDSVYELRRMVDILAQRVTMLESRGK